jgi:23S rRNA (guanosine2251-2'-O)-methyltransferase
LFFFHLFSPIFRKAVFQAVFILRITFLYKLKELGVWTFACDMDGTEYDKAGLSGSLALVIGAEGQGISRLVKEKCDFSLSIPMSGKISSLNASNAAAILMYEVRRQRKDKIK